MALSHLFVCMPKSKSERNTYFCSLIWYSFTLHVIKWTGWAFNWSEKWKTDLCPVRRIIRTKNMRLLNKLQCNFIYIKFKKLCLSSTIYFLFCFISTNIQNIWHYFSAAAQHFGSVVASWHSLTAHISQKTPHPGKHTGHLLHFSQLGWRSRTCLWFLCSHRHNFYSDDVFHLSELSCCRTLTGLQKTIFFTLLKWSCQKILPA